MSSPLDAFVARADIANLALLLWALGTSAALYAVFRELGAANRRFDAFVRELSRFNERHAARGSAGPARRVSPAADAPARHDAPRHGSPRPEPALPPEALPAPPRRAVGG